MQKPVLRPAEPRDVVDIVGLVRELAEFENLSYLLKLTPETLEPYLFGEKPIVECVVGDAAGEVVAYALFFTNFSTFMGKPGLYLEDLYVRPSHRGSGLGQALVLHVARLAVERGCGRFEWSVLDWNANAIRLYEKLGATVLPDWRICRVTGDALMRLAAEA